MAISLVNYMKYLQIKIYTRFAFKCGFWQVGFTHIIQYYFTGTFASSDEIGLGRG